MLSKLLLDGWLVVGGDLCLAEGIWSNGKSMSIDFPLQLFSFSTKYTGTINVLDEKFIYTRIIIFLIKKTTPLKSALDKKNE